MNFVVCINNTDYAASLEVRKIYQVLPDSKANIAVLNQLWKTLTPNPSPRTGEGS